MLAVAFVSFAAGFGQFGAVAALGDVARSFGHLTHGATIADQAGLSGTELGVGLAVLRLASLGGLPLAALADGLGRRRVLLASCAAGLGLTILAAASPGYWWFVVIFALGRPLLSTTSALAQVIAAEQTDTANRSRAVALITAGYGLGAGLIAVVHSLGSSVLGFRGVFGLAVLPLAVVPFVGPAIGEPDRFARLEARARRAPVLGALGAAHRSRLAVVASVAFLLAVTTGPANGFVYLYSQNVRHLSGLTIAAMVVVAGAAGLLGLVVGQWLADRAGRRVTAAGAMIAIALCGMLTYSGSRAGLAIGYVLGILAGSVFAPAAGAFANELFPTAVRASIAGWEVAASVLGATAGLVVFGAIADRGGNFSVAALVTFATALPGAALFFLLPETRGRELEEIWPDAPAADAREA